METKTVTSVVLLATLEIYARSSQMYRRHDEGNYFIDEARHSLHRHLQ